MASTAKYAVDDIISISFRETCAVGEEFLRDFQILDRKQNDIQTTKPVTTLVKSVLNTELACLLLPNEILFKSLDTSIPKKYDSVLKFPTSLT